nr:hypothetical protein [Pseudomonas sp.]
IYEQIKALEDQGQETAAAELAQIAFADALDSRTPQMLENIGSIERGWNAIKRAVSEAVDAMAGIGRASTLQQQLAQAEAGLSQMMDGAYERGAARRMKQVEAQRALIASIQEQISLESGLAMVQKQADQERARSLKAIQDVDAYVSDSSRMSRAAQMEKALNDERQIYEKRVQDAAGNADKLTAIEQAYQTKVSSIRDQFAEKEAKRAGGSGGSRGKSEAQRELERQQREELRMIEAFERERAKLIDGQRNEIAAIEEKTRRIEDEITMYGMGQAAIDALAISRLEEQRAMLAGFDNSEQQIALLDREIAARKRLMSATSQKEALDANKRAAEEAARDWERITDQIGQSLTDALMDGGRSAKRFLEDMFRTMVLRPMLQPAVNGVTGAIGSALGIPGAPNSGLSSGGGILGAASNIKTLYAGITGGLTASLASGVSAIGSAIGSSAVSSFAAGMQGNTLAAGLMGPTTAGAGGAMGAGAMFASAMPWLAGGAILYSLLGDKFKGETRYGGSYYVGDMAEGTKSYLSERPTATRAVYEGGPNGGDPAAEAAKQLMVSTYASLTDAAKQLGGSLEDLALFGSWEVSPEKGNSFVRTIIAGAEGDLYNNKLDLKGVKDSEEVFAAFQAELPKLIIAALQQVDLDDAFDSFLDQIDIAALDEAGVQAVLANLSAMVQFRDALANLPFEELAGLSLQAGLKMAEFSGGMEPLLANMNTYFQAFYSQEEQLANLGNNIAKSLEGVGVAMPATNAEFRAIVESLDVTTEAGQQAYAVMMGLSGSFNQLTAGMDQLAQANTLAAERAAKDQAEAIETVWRDQVGRVQRLAEESSRLLAARNGAGSTLDQIDRAMGRTGQFAGQREAELWAAMATASYEQQIDLASELTTITLERYQQEVAAAERLRDLGASLRSYVEGLRVGDLSPGTMGEKLAEAGRQYADALAKAQSGDTDAMSGLQGMADAYLRLARGYYASSDEYSQIFNSVTGGLDELGVQAQSDAERQIAVGVDSLAQLQALHDVAQGAFDALDRQYQQSVEALAHEASLLVDLGQDTGRLHDIASLLGSMPAEIAARLQPMMDAATRSTVGSWYQDAGRGQGDASGVDYWQGELGKRPEGEVQDSFLWGLIADWYKDDLGRRADENEIAYWFEQAKKNGTQAAYQAFLAGARSELHGSHANGLAYVPFDGYRAELHEGEGVLTAAENRAYQAMPDWSRYGQGGDALVVEVRALRDEVKQLRAERQKGDALVAGTVAASAQANAADVTKGVTNAMSKSGWAGQQAKEATYK